MLDRLHVSIATAARSALALFALLCSLLFSVSLTANDGVRELEWDDLMPKDWDPFAGIAELQSSSGGELIDGSPEADKAMEAFVTAGKSAPVVPELDGQRVKIPGFVVPLDFEGTSVSEFLLVPYFGACIHVPPPPANQIVYVKSKDAYPIDDIYDPVWITGTLSTQAFYNDTGDAGYSMQATGIEPYEE